MCGLMDEVLAGAATDLEPRLVDGNGKQRSAVGRWARVNVD
jgi:hypothetical protein